MKNVFAAAGVLWLALQLASPLACAGTTYLTPMPGQPLTQQSITTIFTFNENGSGVPNLQVEGDLACGDFGPAVHYYNFATATAGRIAGGARCGVQGGRMVYASAGHIMLLEALGAGYTKPTEILASAGANRDWPTIGGKWLAFVDYAYGDGAVFVYDLRTGGKPTQLTPTAQGETNGELRLSPDGNVLVWGHCITGGTCSMWHAELQATGWTLFKDGPITQWPATDGHFLIRANPLQFQLVGWPNLFDLSALAAAWSPSLVWSPAIATGPRGSSGGTATYIAVRQPFGGGAHGCGSSGGAACALSVYRIQDNSAWSFSTSSQLDGGPAITVLPDGRLRVLWCSLANAVAATFSVP